MNNLRETFRDMKPDEMREASREAEIDSMTKNNAPIEYLTPAEFFRRMRVIRSTLEKFGFKKVAITLRSSISANDNDWAGMLYDGENYCFSKTYHMHIVDRVGGGDSFGGGLIYSQIMGYSTQDSIEFAVAASCLKHSIEGDYNMVSVDEVKSLAGGNASGRVQR